MTVIRAALPGDIDAVTDVVVAAEMFAREDEGFLHELFQDFFTTKADEGHRFVVDFDGAEVRGMAYFQPKPATDRVWDLTMIAVRPEDHGRGFGRALIEHVERELVADGARLLVVETSATAQFDATRAFYSARGYEDEARVRDYWADGDDLVLFRKRLIAS